MTQQKKNRREFIQATASAAVLVGAGSQSVLGQQKNLVGGIPTRPLGRTGVHISILGLGGSIGFGDPDAKLGFSYCCNQMHAVGDNGPRARRLIDPVYSCS